MAKVRNLEPKRRVVTLDALKGKKRPGRQVGKQFQPGGIEYPTVTFGPHRGRGLRGMKMPDTIDLPKGGEKSSAIVTGIQQGAFRLLPTVAASKK